MTWSRVEGESAKVVPTNNLYSQLQKPTLAVSVASGFHCGQRGTWAAGV